jgi:hypothetical protein
MLAWNLVGMDPDAAMVVPHAATTERKALVCVDLIVGLHLIREGMPSVLAFHDQAGELKGLHLLGLAPSRDPEAHPRVQMLGRAAVGQPEGVDLYR